MFFKKILFSKKCCKILFCYFPIIFIEAVLNLRGFGFALYQACIF